MISIWDWGVRAFYVVAGNVSALSYTGIFCQRKVFFSFLKLSV